MMKFTIPLIPITKKNSQKIIVLKNGKRMISPSDKYRQYASDVFPYIPRIDSPLSGRMNVKCLYYMPTRRRVDLVNLQEATLDILVQYGIIEDDNSQIVTSMDGSRVYYDKENPRTEIEITESDLA